MKTLKNYVYVLSILFAVADLTAAEENLSSSTVLVSSECRSCESLRQNIDQLRQENEDLRRAPKLTDSIVGFVDTAESRLEAVRAELLKVTAELEIQKKSNRTLEEQNQTLQTTNITLQTQLGAETEAKRTLEAQVAESQGTLASSAADAEATKLEALTMQCARLQQDLDTLFLQKKQLEETNTAQAALVEALRDGNKDLTKKIDALRQKVFDLETENARLSSLKPSVVVAKSQELSLGAELAGATGTVLSFDDQAELTASRAKISALEAQLAAARHTQVEQAQASQTKIDQLEAELSEGRRINGLAELTVTTQATLNTQLQEKVRTLEGQLATAQAEQGRQAQASQTKIGEFETELAAARVTSGQTMQAKDAEISQRQAELTTARERITALEAQLAAARATSEVAMQAKQSQAGQLAEARQVPVAQPAVQIVQPQVSCWKRYLMPAFAGAAMTYFLMKK